MKVNYNSPTNKLLDTPFTKMKGEVRKLRIRKLNFGESEDSDQKTTTKMTFNNELPDLFDGKENDTNL